jgi:hypothetical protein
MNTQENDLEYALAALRYYRDLLEGGAEARISLLKREMAPIVRAIHKIRRDKEEAPEHIANLRNKMTQLHLGFSNKTKISRLTRLRAETEQLEGVLSEEALMGIMEELDCLDN